MNYITAIDSPFFHKEDRIVIFAGDYKIESVQGVYDVSGEVFVTFEPEFALKFTGETAERNNFIREDDLTLIVPDMLPTIGNVTSSRNGTAFEGYIFSQIQNSENPHLDSYILYVMNYIDFFGESVRSHNQWYKGGMSFEIGGWSIELQKRYDYKEIYSILKNNQGFAITHVVEIKRQDRKSFTKNMTSKIVEVLTNLFKLTAGRHINMPIEIGYMNEDVVYENYERQLISPYRRISNWFPKLKGKVLVEIFYQMYEKYNDNYLRDVIKDIIIDYVEALGTTFLEHRVILLQVALEKLAYVLLTHQTPPILSKTKFDKNDFKDNLECILSKLKIETKLKGKYNIFEKNFQSGPHLLAQYRNHIAHPKPKAVFKKYDAEEIYLILNLSLYYTELLLLNLVGYNNVFSNRLEFPQSQGIYEELPWNNPD